jgi:hypothetical protein
VQAICDGEFDEAFVTAMDRKPGQQLRNEANMIIQAAKEYGNNFVDGLLWSALSSATLPDIRKIHDTWPELWAEYLREYDRLMKAR